MLTLLLLLLSYLRYAAPACQSPSECKPVTECPELSSLFKTSLSQADANSLKKNHCGFAGRIPKVCCSPEPEVNAESVLNVTCGYHTESKIVGGSRTGLDEFPWMVLLEYTNPNGSKYFDCGGSLISKRYVLTAAHCVHHLLTGVRLGEYDLASEDDCVADKYGRTCASKPQNFNIERKIIHEQYDSRDGNKSSDIALLRLSQEVTFNDYVKPICLPSSDAEPTSYVGQRLFVAGWGLTENDTKSNIKLKVQVPVNENAICVAKYRSFAFNLDLTTNQLCAGGEKDKDSCTGDSGGPLMTIQKNKGDIQWYIAAIVSFGPTPCGLRDWSAVYTRVSPYLDWIKSKLRP